MAQININTIVGSKYEDTKNLLIHKMQINEDVFMVKPEIHACYFCLKKIQDQMVVISPREENFNVRYFLDLSCYIAHAFEGGKVKNE